MTSTIGVTILAVVGVWLVGGLLARWTGVLLVVVGAAGLASTGDANGFLLAALGAALWLAGHLLYRVRRGIWKSLPAERVFVAATAVWRKMMVRSTGGTSRRMPRELTEHELRNQSAEIMRALDRGEEFVIIRNGAAVGELRPLRHRRFVAADAALAAFEGAPRVDVGRFRKDVDAALDQDATPRA